jgi:hypothetical protein
MMTIHRLLNRAFPFMAISGLLLAAWGLIVTPDDIKGSAQVAIWGAHATSQSLDGVDTTSWRD